MPPDLEARVRALLTTLKMSKALSALDAALSADKAARTVSVITRLEEELSGKMAGRGAQEKAGELRTRRVAQRR